MTEKEQITESSTEKSLSPAQHISLRKLLKARVEELEQQVGTLTAEIETEREKRLRLAAEYDNYRRRTNQEYRQLAETAGERILLKLLPVVDDFNRMTAHQDADGSSLKQGADLIYRKLQGLFESEGVVAIQAVGQVFDSALHEAVAQVPPGDASSGSIVAEVERGYRLGDKILRHAKVVVAQQPDQIAEHEGGTNG